MRFDIHKGHFPIKIPYLLLSELFRSDLCRGDIVFSEKDQAGSWVHLPAAATLPRCPLWCRYQLMHFIREVLVLSSFLSASCSGGAARYQVWPANIPASGAKALWSAERMSHFKETSLQLSPGYLVEVRELICNHKTQSSHLLATPGQLKRGFLVAEALKALFLIHLSKSSCPVSLDKDPLYLSVQQ